MTRETTADNLKDMVKNLGGAVEGKTTAEVLDQLEKIVSPGGSDVTEGTLNDADMDSIFDD